MDVYVSGIPVNVFELLGLGCLIGFLSGFFGIGGGALITPILHIFFGIPFPIGVGSVLSQTTGTAFSAVLRFWQFGDVDAKLALMIVGGNFVGIEIGVHLLDWLNQLGRVSVGNRLIPAIQFYLQWIFLALLIVIAALIFIESVISRGKKKRKLKQPLGLLQRIPMPPYVSFPNSGVRRISLFAVSYSALFVGILTGLLGIGGGVIFVPLIIYGYGVETHTAIGTGLLIVFFSAAYGTVTHAIRGNVDLWLAVPLLIGSTISAQLGAITTRKIGGNSIRFGFAFIVLIVAGIIGVNLLHLIYG
ncbi:MAG: sulfite exporter TauE/SafE family protein [Candidatus Poribacteria bacterium]|nr:sulfite exporter TauE/SafE family protein [Candidatus Poribacteria bacterium]